MTIKDIVAKVNMLVSNTSSNRLNYKRLEFYFETAVDQINNYLGTGYYTPRAAYEKDKWFYNTIWLPTFIGFYDNGNEETSGLPILEFADIEDGSILYASQLCSFYKVVSDDQDEQYYELYNAEHSTLPDGKYYYDYLDYTSIPDPYIRTVLVYQIAALFLEEEDELDSQYQSHMQKVASGMATWQRLEFSMYDRGTDLFGGIKHE